MGLIDRYRVWRASRRGSPPTWPEVRLLIAYDRLDGLTDRLAAGRPADRVALFDDVVRYAEQDPHPVALTVLTLACAPDADAAADLLSRPAVARVISAGQPDPGPAVDAALRREADEPTAPGWAGAVGAGLAARLPPHGGPFTTFRLCVALLRAADAPWPEHDTFARCWLADVVAHPVDPAGRPAAPFTRLLGDPWVPGLLDRLFALGDVDDLMRAPLGRFGPTFVQVLAEQTRQGHLDRADLLDRCLARLSRPDLPHRAGRSLLDALGPTAAEVAERATGFRTLLTEARPPAAGHVQRILRRADRQAPLDRDWLHDVSVAVLHRPERSLVRFQLDWIADVGGRDRAARWRDLAAVAADHADAHVRERAHTLIRRLTPRVTLPPAAPARVASVDDLVGELAQLSHPATVVSVERILDGLVRHHRALGPAGRHLPAARRISGTVAAAIGTVLDRGPAGPPAGRLRAMWGTGPMSRATAPPQRMILSRCLELATRLHRDPVPALVATPTAANGGIDPDALLDRLTRAAREGWEPWPHDLTQALLRLPPDTDPRIGARAAALGSPAGGRLADWVGQGGLPDPVRHRVSAGRIAVSLEPPAWYGDPTGLLSLGPPGRADRADPGLWVAVVPGYREVAAAHLLPWCAALTDGDSRGEIPLLALIAAADGPAGPATALAVAYGLGAHRSTDRDTAVAALRRLAGTGRLDPAVVGGDLATLIDADLVRVNRVVEALGRTVTDDPETVWAVLRGALPALAAAPVPARALGSLVGLATRAAGAAGAGSDPATVDGLADLAGRPGRAAATVEARRLRLLLGEGRS